MRIAMCLLRVPMTKKMTFSAISVKAGIILALP